MEIKISQEKLNEVLELLREMRAISSSELVAWRIRKDGEVLELLCHLSAKAA